MKALLVVLVALLALVHAQNIAPPWADYTAFTATFECSAPQFGTGVFTGKLLYDWSIGAFEIIFDGDEQYQEFYQFNKQRGYNTQDTTGQFAFQYLYKSSKSCPCETTSLQFAMPPLFVASADPPGMLADVSKLSYWLGDGKTTDTTTFLKPAIKYNANDAFIVPGTTKTYTLSSFFWLRDGVPAGFNINDFQRRTFEFTSITVATPGDKSIGLVAPTSGCKCGKQMDVVLSLDRSGSISRSQWGLEYQFVQQLTAAFQYGPLATNLGIGNWNAKQWETLSITAGINEQVVTSAVSSMDCCPGASSTSCCCCGTPIGGGIWLGGTMLSRSTRGKSQKCLILLTDGCQNHIWDSASQTAISCGCASEKLCAQNATCVGDISKYYSWVTENIPGTRIIVVGVGGADTICKDQLLTAAGNDPNNMFNPTDWSQLLTLVQTITATACTADNALCPGCCGICTCGQCIPPTKCKDKDACNTGVLDNTGCCTSAPVTCPDAPCKFSYCDDKTGCALANLKCEPDELCTTYVCDPAVNEFACTGVKKTNPDGSDIPACTTVVVYKCVNNTQCADTSDCTTDVCDLTTHSCKYTTVSCPAGNKCITYNCKTKGGCQASQPVNCDDGNDCTTDSCDPTLGCQNIVITCDKPKDPCTVVECFPKGGCVESPRDCSKEGFVAVNCTVPACNETCYNQYICAAPPPTSSETFPETVVLVSTLTTAAVAGIVIAAVLLAAGLGGGAAVAIAQVAAGGGAVVTASNPLYAGAGLGGDNPLNQG